MKEWTKEELKRIYSEDDREELEALHEEISHSRWREDYHIQTVTGLMNDPNGFSYFDGKWHLFYQWFPYGGVHGMKHWYHVVSDDLLHWKNIGLAIKPDTVYDNCGCYSGSGFVKEEYLYLVYTGNHREPDGQRIPYQMIAAMDKENHISKLRQPIILPHEEYTEHQRDPHIFFENDYYWILLGAQDEGLTGHLLLYRSEQIAVGWEFYGELKVKGYEDGFGYMAECPDIEKIGDKWLLLFSPQGYEPQGDEFRNKCQNVYMIGDLDLEKRTFTPDAPMKELDRGFDFYAAQCANQKVFGNAAVLAGWFGVSGSETPATDEEGWSHLQTLPRILTIKDGKLIQKPVPSADALKGNLLFEAKDGKIVFDNMHGRMAESCVIRVDDPGDESVELNLFSRPRKNGFVIKYDHNSRYLTIDRGDLNHQMNTEYGTDRRIYLEEGLSALDIFVDHSSVEIFVNDGEYVMSSRYFADEEEHLIRMRGKDISLSIWKARKTVEDDFVI